MPEDKELIETYAAKMVGQGWQLVYQTERTVALRWPKQWNRTLLIAGVILLPFAGFGLFILLLALIDFLIKPERRIEATAAALRAGREPVIPSDWSKPMIGAAVVVGSLLACILFFSLISYVI